MNQRAIPDIDRDKPRLGHAHRCHLVERHLRAVGIDHNRVEQMGGSATSAQPLQFSFQDAARALHAALDLIKVVRCCVSHGSSSNAAPPSYGANAASA